VRETIRAICPRPDPEVWKAFHVRLAEKGKARIILRVNVAEEGQMAAAFEGIFVVQKNVNQERVS
jgi:thioesterase domain-containing protein